ncbi:MAG: phosphoribosylformylglycinamidine cyclo-ligase [Methanomassiliicoccaceae archaeon]|jgi:phosphoribosylformylglycinamidine cyclo-ligase|nr:phosphoribosylformylglycinamidine cyclo-ligase [Methanomassiliicoccaceae archaeon]
MSGWTYAKAGVNIDDKSSAIESLVKELKFKRTGKGRASDLKGMFTSLIEFGDDYLTLCTDGVGTKLLIAAELGIWDTVGIDCIAMNVNDTICVGAEPISFVDYIAIDRPDEDLTNAIGKGLEKGAEMSNMEIVGGEIAVLPDMVKSVDLSGTCLGFVNKKNVITGQDVSSGDSIISLAASGVHSNGLTLARKVFESAGIGMREKTSGIKRTVGMELLEPTEIYVRRILSMIKDHKVTGMVNITGGGLRNLLRMRKGLRYVIDDPVKPLPIFDKMQELGNIETREMYQTFNMGMGYTIVAPPDEAEAIVSENRNAKIVGFVEKGNGVLYKPDKLLYEHY